ncbi:transposase [Arsenophonus nasoniae]|nr:transposase [Arsenophonus nasoniae]WGM17270.1 transposase [Arsenophonus nasoniae]
MLQLARKQGIEIGIFCALHTYGRQLNQHPHVHVSVTRGVWIVNIVYGESCFSKKRMSKKSGEGCYPTTASQL